jgi:DNA-binding MarR family transcriptional regulator
VSAVPTTADRKEIEAAAEEIFELTKLSWMARDRQHRHKGQIDLTESEFLALDALAKADPQAMRVGEIQKRIGVLPAQMSRVIRSLEGKAGKRLIRCQINPADKRKIDVTLTEIGRRAHKAFRDARLASSIEFVAQLNPEDRAEFMRILHQFRSMLGNQLGKQ